MLMTIDLPKSYTKKIVNPKSKVVCFHFKYTFFAYLSIQSTKKARMDKRKFLNDLYLRNTEVSE